MAATNMVGTFYRASADPIPRVENIGYIPFQGNPEGLLRHFKELSAEELAGLPRTSLAWIITDVAPGMSGLGHFYVRDNAKGVLTLHGPLGEHEFYVKNQRPLVYIPVDSGAVQQEYLD
ncbi:hypothetical protein HZB02_05200 [Candidatus Woesearchaeota archaeon]|nr:hypothetical protein [Candidatus Woesearchaeota archaeon]